ncbi:MAG: Fpg/Nei family DNA glycosylase [Firmicutes bacterium]|nr:Fpg/Nei family DNA glycosylase [Bacillota bacterium]
MPELPEIFNISQQLNQELIGRTITNVTIHQEKCLNYPISEFSKLVTSNIITKVSSLGKWIFIYFESEDNLAINLGMGGDLLYVDTPPTKKHQAVLYLDNNKLLSFRFWWFGYIHFHQQGDAHPMTDQLGIDPIRSDISKTDFIALFKGKKGSLKTFLLNQKNLAGIGNYYIHDILYNAKINPNAKMNDLSTHKLGMLYTSIIDELNTAIQLRGAHYELDIYHQPGHFRVSKVAYKDGQPCQCGTTILKVKTGATSSYYCPKCQK